MKFDELVGFLITYELSLPKSEKKNKGMAFKNSITDKREHVYSKTDHDVSESIAMLAKNFGRVIKRLDKRSGRNVSLDGRDNQPRQEFQKGENFQRSECDGDRFNFNNFNRSKRI